MDRLRRINWIRVGLAFLVLILIVSVIFAFKKSKPNEATGKDVSVESIDKSLKGKNADGSSTQKQGSSATKTQPPATTPPPRSLGGESDEPAKNAPATPKPTTSNKPATSDPKLANSGPGETAGLLFAVTAVSATVYQYRRKVFALADQ